MLPLHPSSSYFSSGTGHLHYLLNASSEYFLQSGSFSFAVKDGLQGLVGDVVQLLLGDGQPGDGDLPLVSEKPQLGFYKA